ncbi:MAG TPA: hypothetical protein VJ853_04640 [Thermoanaerobaculia bacterium]|nr:hypothetical protein [Thermoanaerobaculia bacterium]
MTTVQNRPSWYTNEMDSGWDRVKSAFANDWEQTKHDFGSNTARDLGQDVPDTVRQATGSEDAFTHHEPAFRFGYAANRNYRKQYPAWNNDLENRLRQDYGADWNRDRDYIRRAYEYRWDRLNESQSGDRGEQRL